MSFGTDREKSFISRKTLSKGHLSKERANGSLGVDGQSNVLGEILEKECGEGMGVSGRVLLIRVGPGLRRKDLSTPRRNRSLSFPERSGHQ